MTEGPRLIDDGLLACREATVYVCDADSGYPGAYDVHLNIGSDAMEHVMLDSTASLYDRGTLREAWEDAADWLYNMARTLQAMAEHIEANGYFEGVQEEES